MDDLWLERLQEIEPYKAEKSHFRYYQFYGTNDFLQSLSSFMTKYFKPWNEKIDVKSVSKLKWISFVALDGRLIF